MDRFSKQQVILIDYDSANECWRIPANPKEHIRVYDPDDESFFTDAWCVEVADDFSAVGFSGAPMHFEIVEGYPNNDLRTMIRRLDEIASEMF